MIRYVIDARLATLSTPALRALVVVCAALPGMSGLVVRAGNVLVAREIDEETGPAAWVEDDDVFVAWRRAA